MKTAIVTGASSGIGLAVSQMLAAEYLVYGFGRDFSRCTFSDKQFIPVTCDLTNTNDLCKRITAIRKQNEVSVLINNAGAGYFGPHEELNPQKIQEMVTVNLLVPLILSQQLLRDLKKHHGYLINISSVTAKKASPHGAAYGATKAGLSSFSASLFEEARKYGVKVVSIHPDMTKTDFYRNANFMEGPQEDTYLHPEEVAAAVKTVLSVRDGIVMTDLTLVPQKHQITRKKRAHSDELER